MRSRQPDRVVWVACAAIAAIGISGAVTFNRIQMLNASVGWVAHTDQIRLTLQNVMTVLRGIEPAARAYPITRSDVLAASSGSAHRQLDRDLRALVNLVTDSLSQLARGRPLRSLTRARLEILDRSVEPLRAETFQLPVAAATTVETIRRTQAERAQLATMECAQETLLAARFQRTYVEHRMAFISVLSMSALAIGLMLFLVILARRARLKLRRSQEQLETTLDSIVDGVITTDAGGTVRFLNPTASALTGWTRSQARGKSIEQVFRTVDESDRQPSESPVARIVRAGSRIALPHRSLLVRRDGSELPIEDTGAPIRDADGAIAGVVLVFKDASAIRAAQDALRASEERLRLALEGASLGAFDHDLLRRRGIWNDRMYIITGFESHTAVSGDMLKLGTAAEDASRVSQVLQRARSAHVSFQMEHRIVRARDGALRWVAANGLFLYDNDGNAVRVIGVLRDITDQNRLEQQVRENQKLDALGTLAGGIAHDFNNILAVLRGNLSLLREDTALLHPYAASILDMTAACDRGAALVRQILTFGRRQEQDRQVLQLADIVAEGLRLLRATIPARIEIRTEYGRDLPAALLDPNQIYQVIANLGINAAHAMQDRGGVIEVQLESVRVDASLTVSCPELHEGLYLRLSFSDNGTGISKAIVERIFEPFFTTKPATSGTGLGLSVVRGILKNHDGAITVYSEPGKGTRFHLYFPAAETRLAQASVTSIAQLRGRGERILYIDDEASLVLLATRMLQRMGYQVSGFSIAAEALAAFHEAPGDFDLVLTDLSMPGTSGMEVARSILTRRPDIPVLLASGYVRPEDVELARSIGIREVIWKPQTISEIGDLLARQFNSIPKRQPH